MKDINKEDFLDWYFGGSDQEKEQTLIEIGSWVMMSLYDSGFYSIIIDDLINDANLEVFYEDTNIK